MLVHFWPELLAGLALGVTLYALYRIDRTRRRHRAFVLNRECWRCGYPLRGITSERCPECGQDLSVRFDAGRWSHGFRVALAAVFALVPLFSYVSTAPDMPRAGEFSRWMGWESRWLYRRVRDGRWDRSPYTERRRGVVEISPADGTVARVIAPGGAPSDRAADRPAGLAIGSDGTSLYFAHENAVVECEVESGRIRRRFPNVPAEFLEVVADGTALLCADRFDGPFDRCDLAGGRTSSIPRGGSSFSSLICRHDWNNALGVIVIVDPKTQRPAAAYAGLPDPFRMARRNPDPEDVWAVFSRDGCRMAVLGGGPPGQRIQVFDTSRIAGVIRSAAPSPAPPAH
jgi:hypothetical protein